MTGRLPPILRRWFDVVMTRRTAPRILSVLALVAAGAMAVTGCAPASSGAAEKSTRIVVGADDATEKHWTLIKDQLAEEGIEIEVRNFTDGVQLNNGVKDGDLDINLFQHLIFLAEYNVDNDADLVPVGATAVYPLALYSEKYDSVDDIPKGSTVAVPNNPTNLARALLNLQTAGLLELKGGGDALSTPADVVSSEIELKPVDSNQTVAALKDGSAQAAVVNNTQAQRGGLGDELIIFKEDLDDPQLAPYINAFVVREDRKDEKVWQKIIDVYHSTEIEKAVTELNQGNLKFKGEWSPTQLEDELSTLEEEIRTLG